jgi:hypothetical protein
VNDVRELWSDSGWSGQAPRELQEYQPRGDDMRDALKGKGQKGGDGRDAWIIFAKPNPSQPVQIEHPRQAIKNAGGQARPLRE